LGGGFLPPPGRPRGAPPPREQPGFDELRQARRQRRRRHAAEGRAELVEALGALHGGVEDRERPAPFEEVRRTADLLGDRLTPTAAHGQPPARALARAPRRRRAPGGTSSPRARPPGRRRDRRGSAPG